MKRFGLLSSLLLVAGFVFELACRVEDRIRYGMPLLSPIRQEEDLVVRDRLGVHGRPNAQYEQFVLNSLGMRGPEASFDKAPGTLRVVTVGASETFGLYESANQEFPRQLEDSLNALFDRSCDQRRPHRVEVLNAALFGMSIPTSIQDVRLRIAPAHPDIIVAYPPAAAYLDDAVPHAPKPDSSGRELRLSWKRGLYPRAVARIRDQAKAMLPAPIADWLRRRDTQRQLRRHPADWRWNTVPLDRLAAYDADLRTLIGTIRAADAQPVLATHGNAFAPGEPRDQSLLARWERFYPRATGETIVAFDSAARLVTLRVARDSGVAVIDLQQMLHARIARGGPRLFQDYGHFTTAGATVVAGALSHTVRDALTRSGSLACNTPPIMIARQQTTTAGGTR